MNPIALLGGALVALVLFGTKEAPEKLAGEPLDLPSDTVEKKKRKRKKKK